MKRYKKYKDLKPCNVCSLRLSENNKTSEHLAIFHPDITNLILKMYKKLKSFPKINRKFPAMDCSNLCATKIVANYLIMNIVKNEPSCLVLVKQLAEKLSSLSDLSLISNKQMQCNLCGLNLLSTFETISHLALRHPEYLALVLFLRFRPLSELNFYVHEVADNKTTSQKLLQRIDGTRVLGVRQPSIQIKKLPDHLYQECIAKGFVNLKEKNRTRSPFDPQPNPRLNEISTKVVQKMKESATKSSLSNEKNSVVLAPGNILNSHKENSASEVCIASCSLSSTIDANSSKVICYGVEDEEIDHLRRQSEKDTIMKKQLLLKKLLDKHHEKEARKEVVYWQRGLTAYVKRNRRYYFGELKEQLLCARKLLRNVGGYENLLAQVNSDLESGKVRKTIKFYLKKIFKAIENVQILISKGDGSERIEQPLIQVDEKMSAPKDGCDKKLNSNTTDLLVNTSLVTEDKQLVECYCGKLNCEGLHPENLIH